MGAWLSKGLVESQEEAPLLHHPACRLPHPTHMHRNPRSQVSHIHSTDEQLLELKKGKCAVRQLVQRVCERALHRGKGGGLARARSTQQEDASLALL